MRSRDAMRRARDASGRGAILFYPQYTIRQGGDSVSVAPTAL